MVKIDSKLNAEKGDFRFNRDVAHVFASHVRKSVPFYDEVQRMILEISDWFIHPNSTVYDLGMSVGETIAYLYQKHSKLKNPRFIGVDSSKEMLQTARENLINTSNVLFIEADLNLPFEIRNASLVTMLYTLQFIKPENRSQLIKEIYDGLNDNGALIMLEKIVGNNSNFNELFIELYEDMKIRNGLTLSQIKSKADSLRGVLLPYTQEKNIDMLQQAGFKDIDIFFKWYNFIGIIAVK